MLRKFLLENMMMGASYIISIIIQSVFVLATYMCSFKFIEPNIFLSVASAFIGLFILCIIIKVAFILLEDKYKIIEESFFWAVSASLIILPS